MIEEILYNGSNTIAQHWIYEYHANGKMKLRTEYRKGKLSSIEKYNEDGKRIEVISYRFSDGKPNGYDRYEFDENGNIIKTTFYDAEGNVIERG